MTVAIATTNIFYIILSVSFIFILCKHAHPELNPSLEDQLNREARKVECCVKNMRCCRKRPPPPNVEIRAVIARCIDPPNVCSTRRNLKKNLNVGNMNNLEKFQGFDEDEPLVQSEVTKCVRKLILTIKIRNEGETNTRYQFIVIDHVYDPLSDKTVRLLNPYIIKMRQEHISQTYELRFLDFVNSKAREQVYNKHDGNYTGCCVNEKRPTCGYVTYQGKPIPYSSGFCCSCDARKNAERQPQTEPNPVIAYSDPAYLLDAVQCPRSRIDVKKSDLRKNNRIPEEKRKQMQKDNQKRNMEDDNIYYINPQNMYKHKHRHPIDNRKEEFESEFGYSKPIDINFGTMASNNRNNLNNKKISENVDKGKDEIAKLSKAYKDNKENTDTQDSAKDGATLNTKFNKPSMHKLLNSDNILFPDNIYDFKSNMEKIANKAFKDAIKSQNARDSNKKNLENDKGPLPVEAEFDLPDNIYEKRQVQSSGIQRRGGQNCADRYTPPHLNQESYHESTHCLRFSPVWYGVYRLEKPVVEQEIIFQVYVKYETQSGIVRWKDLTGGKRVKLGTFWLNFKDEVPSISMAFSSVFDDEDFCLDWNKLRLLIPEGLKVSELVKYPEARGGPSEFLLVPGNKIMLTGDQCDVAGVGFEAFVNQPNRCSMPKGSCLNHQPFNLWNHDKKLERNGKRGCYFLKHHGKLSKNPIRSNSSGRGKFLSLNYYGRYISLVDMEINADFNAVLRPTTSAVITEVYVDSTCPTVTFLTIKVSNAGLLSSKFMVRVCDCPLDLRGKLNDIQSDVILIPPQNQHIFKLSIRVLLSVDIFHCSVEVLNAEGELLALRRIKIQKLDRCICTWHCLCACIGSSAGLKCVPMTIDHYHAAGFKGGLPGVTRVEHVTLNSDVLHIVLFIIFFILFMLFMLGLTKALLGLCSLPVGMWGLNVLLDLPKPMNRYYDKKLADRPVKYDNKGWPLHPDTGEKMRNIPAGTEFCINILFFFTYPTVMFLLLLGRICCPFHRKNRKKRYHEDKRHWPKKQKCDFKTCLSQQTHVSGDYNEIDSDISPIEETKGKGGDNNEIDSNVLPTEKTKNGKGGDYNEVNSNVLPTEKTKKGKFGKKRWQKSTEKPEENVKESTNLKNNEKAAKDDKEDIDKKNNEVSAEEEKDTNPKKKKMSQEIDKDDTDPKKIPTIKVSIKEHQKEPKEGEVSSKKSVEDISDNPYYYTSTEEASPYTVSEPSRKTSGETSNITKSSEDVIQ